MRKFIISQEIIDQYPELAFFGVKVNDVTVTEKLQYVKAQKKRILSSFRDTYDATTVEDARQVKAIRNLFEKMGIETENTPTAVENLTYLFYKGGLPSINSVVDSANLASLGTQMPIGVFDEDKIEGDLTLRLSQQGEEYKPIGKETEALSADIVVLADTSGIIGRPMYKDSERTMISLETKNVLVLTAQYPEINDDDVEAALELAVDIITTSSNGTAEEMFKFE